MYLFYYYLAINDILLQEYKVVFSKKFGLNNLCITTYEIEPAVLIEGLEINHINPSYIKLPIEYILLINSFPYQYCSNVDENNDIINFKYISAPSITGYRVLFLYIQPIYKNKFEIALNNCEDNKYEIDTNICWIKSTIEILEEIKDKFLDTVYLFKLAN